MAIEYRWAEGQYDRLPALAADLVRRQVAVIAATGDPGGARRQSRQPRRFRSSSLRRRPGQAGLVASLNRPGGNMTGVNLFTTGARGEAAGAAARAGSQGDDHSRACQSDQFGCRDQLRDLQEAAARLGRAARRPERASTEGDFDAAFATSSNSGRRARGLHRSVLQSDRRDQLVALAARHAMPTIYESARVRRGRRPDELRNQPCRCLSSGRRLYRPHSQGRQARRPAGLQSTKFELVINLRPRRRSASTVPPTLLARADEVIE